MEAPRCGNCHIREDGTSTEYPENDPNTLEYPSNTPRIPTEYPSNNQPSQRARFHLLQHCQEEGERQLPSGLITLHSRAPRLSLLWSAKVALRIFLQPPLWHFIFSEQAKRKLRLQNVY